MQEEKSGKIKIVKMIRRTLSKPTYIPDNWANINTSTTRLIALASASAYALYSQRICDFERGELLDRMSKRDSRDVVNCTQYSVALWEKSMVQWNDRILHITVRYTHILSFFN